MKKLLYRVMPVRRKKYRKLANEELLQAIFAAEKEWKYLRQIVDNSVEVMYETELHIKLAEAKYMMLLKEAKIRNITVLRY